MTLRQRRRALMAAGEKGLKRLYALPEPYTFPSTMTNLETDCALLDIDRDYTILFRFNPVFRDYCFACNPGTLGDPWYTNAAKTKGIYWGKSGQVGGASRVYAYGQYAALPMVWNSVDRVSVVIQHNKESTSVVSYYRVNNGDIANAETASGTFSASNNPVFIRGKSGTLQDLQIYEGILSMADITSYLEVDI